MNRDQRMQAHEHKPHQVYVLRSSDDQILYVGVSSNVRARVRDHQRKQPWTAEIDPKRTVVTDEMPWEEALATEQALIEQHQPKHNKYQRNGSRYVAFGIRKAIAEETRLKRAARTGDPAAVKALDDWMDEQVRLALDPANHIEVPDLFGQRTA